MSIKVTLGEAKTQSEKPFPKLMSNGSFIILFERPGKGIHLLGHYQGVIATSINMEGFVDYNEPIALQND